MLLLIITILAVILGGMGLYYEDHDALLLPSIALLVIGMIFLIIEVICLAAKPITYKEFKIEYNIVKEQITSKDDVRDATFTQNIIKINQKIMSCREYIDDIWLGIYEDKKICDMELLKKDE